VSQTQTAPELRIGEAATYLKVSQEWLRDHAEEVGVFWIGKQRRFRISDLDAYIERARRGPERVSS
jgi:excisionase family DNA binding protein